MSINEIIIANVKRLIAEQNITKTKLASDIGIDPTYLSRLLAGKPCVSPEMSSKIAEALMVPEVDLVRTINKQAAA